MGIEPTREHIDTMAGELVVEFGSEFCGHCIAAQPLIAGTVGERPLLKHLKIEDGRGRRLGRSFGVKLWPTLVFLRDGREVARVVRPRDEGVLRQALDALD